jgi:hypothetical protein
MSFYANLLPYYCLLILFSYSIYTIYIHIYIFLGELTKEKQEYWEQMHDLSRQIDPQRAVSVSILTYILI